MAFGSLLGALSRTLPGYMQGERQAIQDNWADLNQYNRVQAGQLGNLWTEATWQPRLDIAHNAALDSAMNTSGNLLDLWAKWAWEPATIYQGQAVSQMSPYTAAAQAQLQYQTLLQAMRNLNNPNALPFMGSLMQSLFPMGMGGAYAPSAARGV